MFLQPLDLTTALRPSLLPNEELFFVQDAVGIYAGKYKLPNSQNGHAYLTTHRICYVDNAEPRKSSISIDLKSVDRYEFYAGFLKSSAKITLYPKAAKRTSIQTQSQSGFSSSYANLQDRSRSSNASPISLGETSRFVGASGPSTPRRSSATWVCPICSFSNPVPASFDPASATANTPIPPCQACGIKPTYPHILKAAIANASGRPAIPVLRQASPGKIQPPPQPLLESHHQYNEESKEEYCERPARIEDPSFYATSRFQCSRCTFLNHPSLLSCEMCGASLLSTVFNEFEHTQKDTQRPESIGPSPERAADGFGNDIECVKLSFRAGGEKPFYEKLKIAMIQRRWILQNAPPIPQPSIPGEDSNGGGNLSQPQPERPKFAGIAGLERRGLELRRKNEAVIGSAFEDLDALIASAKEIVALAESFAKKSDDGSSDAEHLIAESAKALDMVTTKDMLGSSAGSESLYLSELSRNLAEYLTDDAKGVLRKEGGIMSLVDLWAVFNRARGGIELISPTDFEKAARLWERLHLPVRLRQFKNGLLVVQQADRTDRKTIAQLLSWLQETHSQPGNIESHWDVDAFGRGITAQEAAMRFGWSVGVASEELEMAEERGALVREEGVEGSRFWENWIVGVDEAGLDDGIVVEGILGEGVDEVVRNLTATGLL